MPRPVEREIRCDLGHAFRAHVHRAVNASADPASRDAILGGTFNVVECPICHRLVYADVPFLYHDSDERLALWVYPERQAGREVEIRAKLRRVAEVLAASVGEGLRDVSSPEDTLLFGIAALRERLRQKRAA